MLLFCSTPWFCFVSLNYSTFCSSLDNLLSPLVLLCHLFCYCASVIFLLCEIGNEPWTVGIVLRKSFDLVDWVGFGEYNMLFSVRFRIDVDRCQWFLLYVTVSFAHPHSIAAPLRCVVWRVTFILTSIQPNFDTSVCSYREFCLHSTWSTK